MIEPPGEALLPPRVLPFGKRLCDQVALVGVHTVRSGTRLPTGWATGQLDEDAPDAVKEYFDQHADAVHRVVLMHHSPLGDVPPVDGIELRFADPSPEIVRNWPAWAGATLVLCGHTHEQRVVRCDEGYTVVERESMSGDPPYRMVKFGPHSEGWLLGSHR